MPTDPKEKGPKPSFPQPKTSPPGHEDEMTPQADGVRFTHTVRMKGPTKFLFSRLLGKQIAGDLRAAVKTLGELAEQRYANEAAENAPIAQAVG